MRAATCLALVLTLALAGCGKSPAGTGANDGGGCTVSMVSFRNPPDNATVNGTVAIQLDVTGQCAIQQVEVFADDTSIQKMTEPPFSFFWDTTALQESNYRLKAVATDSQGNTGETSIDVVVRQDCSAANCPPAVRFLAPANGSTVCGKVTLYADATDDHDVPTVTFSVDGQPLGEPLTTAPYLQDWDTSSLSPGMHVLEADAKDSAGLTSRYVLHLSVAAPGQCTAQGPVVALACPPPDPQGQVSCVTGTTTLCAAAHDANPITSVTYGINGSPLAGPAPQGPQWNATWDTSKSDEHLYQLQITAIDSQGLSTKQTRSVQVDRTPPTVTLTQPMDGAMVQVGMPVQLTVTASDASPTGAAGCGVASVTYQVSGPATATLTASTAPFAASWDTTGQPAGMYTLTATATDRAGLTASNSVHFVLTMP